MGYNVYNKKKMGEKQFVNENINEKTQAIRLDIMAQHGEIRKKIKDRKKKLYVIDDEETFEKAIEDYFDFIEEKGIMPIKGHLAKWLGITTEQLTMFSGGYGCERWKSDLIAQALDDMKSINSTAIYTKPKPVGEIFMGKAEYGMIETQKIEVKSNEEITLKEFDRRIKELSGK